MELNENEKNIVDLINNLSEASNDRTTAKEVIDNIIGKIKRETAESISREMKEAERPYVGKPEFPDVDLVGGMRNGMMGEHEKMVADLLKTFSQQQEIQSQQSLIFTRVREVKSPGKAHPTDAGIDFYVPDAKAWDEEFRNMVVEYSRNPVPCSPDEGVEFIDDYLKVAPGAHVAIPSGIKTIIPPGLAMMMVNKSGIATKLKLDHSACLIDSEYRDELIFCFFNHNTESVRIEPGMKITQGLIVPVINLGLQEVLNCVYDDMGKETDRGGGFGSSGTK